MNQAQIDGIVLEYEVRGSGEPVVLIHGSHIADAFSPLMNETALTRRYRLFRYRRRGFPGSSHPGGPLGIDDQASDCRAFLQHLGISRAHIVGHSYGGVIALQLALDAPDMVHSLALLEPALFMVPSGPMFLQAMAPLQQLYESGDKAGAVDGFLQAVVGPGYRKRLDAVLPNAFAHAVSDADTFFRIEMPALQQWEFKRADAQRISQPILLVRGGDSPTLWPGWLEVQDLLQAWLPQTESFVLDGAMHGLQIFESAAVAKRFAGFFAQHPLHEGDLT